jgi:hypothetical protein
LQLSPKPQVTEALSPKTTAKMVKLALPLAALAMAASVAAAPAPAEASPAVSGATFSFEAWVEDIIANPDTAMTVDEAIAAAEAAEVVGLAGGLQTRATCDANWPRANVCLFPALRQHETNIELHAKLSIYPGS